VSTPHTAHPASSNLEGSVASQKPLIYFYAMRHLVGQVKSLLCWNIHFLKFWWFNSRVILTGEVPAYKTFPPAPPDASLRKKYY